jgi:type IV pilus assembly protein PilB
MKEFRIGDRLVESGIISEEQRDFALNEQKRTGERLGTVLRRLNLITEDDLARMLAESIGVEYINLRNESVDPKITAVLNESFVRRYKVFPVSADDGTVTIAMADPLDVMTIDRVQQQSGRYPKVMSASEFDILTAIDRFYGTESESSMEEMIADSIRQVDAKGSSDAGGELAEVAPIVKLIDSLILAGIRDRATDVHFEPEKDLLRIRYRIDGVLHQGPYIPKKIEKAINSRLKIMSSINISEQRLPQDGKATVSVYGRTIDLRVATFPTIFGENVVLRVLNRENLTMGLEHLGFSQTSLDRFKRAIEQPNGIVLVTGPTGSGKTTSLYAALLKLNTTERKIITLEDPVEYELPLIRQSQINVRAGLTYATGLRAILRQDPDIIFVGEMRDQETIDTAIRAALTGLLVFSTLHTNDAAATVPRLMDMGVEPYLVASSLVGIVAQRLVRVICRFCKEEVVPNADLVKSLNAPATAKYYRGTGCRNCDGTGYRSRSVVSEVMLMSPGIRKAIMDQAEAGVIRKISHEEGMKTMLEDGVQKALDGVTTLEEIARVV